MKSARGGYTRTPQATTHNRRSCVCRNLNENVGVTRGGSHLSGVSFSHHPRHSGAEVMSFSMGGSWGTSLSVSPMHHNFYFRWFCVIIYVIHCFLGIHIRCVWGGCISSIWRWVSWICFCLNHLQHICDTVCWMFFVTRWQPDSKFLYSRLKFPPKPDPSPEFLENQEVEVYSSSGGNSQDACGWWKSKIKVNYPKNFP